MRGRKEKSLKKTILDFNYVKPCLDSLIQTINISTSKPRVNLENFFNAQNSSYIY